MLTFFPYGFVLPTCQANGKQISQSPTADCSSKKKGRKKMKSQTFLWLGCGMWCQKCLKTSYGALFESIETQLFGEGVGYSSVVTVWNKIIWFLECIDGFLVCIWGAKRWLCPCQNNVHLCLPLNARQFLGSENVTRNANQSFLINKWLAWKPSMKIKCVALCSAPTTLTLESCV